MGVKIKGEIREFFGKNASRRLRREGLVPANLYGTETENVSLILDKKDIFEILRSEAGENTIFKITYDSKTLDVMIKEIQTNPANDLITFIGREGNRPTLRCAVLGGSVPKEIPGCSFAAKPGRTGIPGDIKRIWTGPGYTRAASISMFVDWWLNAGRRC